MAKRKIKEFPNNPREITQQQLTLLQQSMAEYGSLDGFVVNLADGKYKNCIISGNQKHKSVDLNTAEITIIQKYDPPTATGTVAVGNVLYAGEYFPYREVSWSEQKCEVANLRANNFGGTNDTGKLALFSGEVLKLGGIDFALEKQIQLLRVNFSFGGIAPAAQTDDHGDDNYEPDVLPDRVQDAFDSFLANSIRQVVLFFEGQAYEDFINRMGVAKEKLGAADNTEAVLKLLEFYEQTITKA